MIKAELQLATYLHGLHQLIVISGVVEFQFQHQLFSIGVLLLRRLEGMDLLFEVFDLRDGALHRDLERLHGAFESLKKVHLHHADQEGLAFALRERKCALLFVVSRVL